MKTTIVLFLVSISLLGQDKKITSLELDCEYKSAIDTSKPIIHLRKSILYFPLPSYNKGKLLKDLSTGIIYKSTGVSWAVSKYIIKLEKISELPKEAKKISELPEVPKKGQLYKVNNTYYVK